ncbi:isatin hydrolase-like [Babylonia areolata]|uniref:isatin hydrolase-like n=1 Tax=Babylonia areolata TaxID=304850 RepID=UPI003FD0E4D7
MMEVTTTPTTTTWMTTMRFSWLLPGCLMMMLMPEMPRAVVEVVDLTYDFSPASIYWPGNPAITFTIQSRGNQSAGYWYESNSFSTPEHAGTHVDSPAHFYEGSWRVEEIPASHLVGPAVVVDVQAKAAQDPDYLMSVQDLEDWEEVHGQIPPMSVVMMNSGWGRRYPNVTEVFGSAHPTDPTTFHFPGIHPDAATFLATRRRVIAAGVDTPSVDFGQSKTFPTHVILGRNNVLGLENLANVERLPARGATVVVGLVKLVDGSGGPARILALAGDGADIFEEGSGRGGCSSGAAQGRSSRSAGEMLLVVLFVVVVLVGGVVGGGDGGCVVVG